MCSWFIQLTSDLKSRESYNNIERWYKEAKENVLKEANTLEGWPEIRGYDFEGNFLFDEFMKSYFGGSWYWNNGGFSVSFLDDDRNKNLSSVFNEMGLNEYVRNHYSHIFDDIFKFF